MKLIRFELNGPKIGAITGERGVELVAAGSRWSTVQAIAGAGPGALVELQSLVERASAKCGPRSVRAGLHPLLFM
jgi:hypothetical protein